MNMYNFHEIYSQYTSAGLFVSNMKFSGSQTISGKEGNVAATFLAEKRRGSALFFSGIKIPELSENWKDENWKLNKPADEILKVSPHLQNFSGLSPFKGKYFGQRPLFPTFSLCLLFSSFGNKKRPKPSNLISVGAKLRNVWISGSALDWKYH